MNGTAAIKLVVKIRHDDFPESPAENDGWKPYSFSTKHTNFKHPEDFGDDEDFERKLKEGLAFPLSYFEHGQSLWTLKDELPPGANCRFDSVGLAGFIVWEWEESDLGPKTVEERRADARAWIARYTYWCNGEVYGYHVEAQKQCCECGSTVDAEADVDIDLPSCTGYYPDDIDGMVIDIKDQIGTDYEVTFEEMHPYGVAEECEKFWKGDK